jgi:hypothetical protein
MGDLFQDKLADWSSVVTWLKSLSAQAHPTPHFLWTFTYCPCFKRIMHRENPTPIVIHHCKHLSERYYLNCLSRSYLIITLEYPTVVYFLHCACHIKPYCSSRRVSYVNRQLLYNLSDIRMHTTQLISFEALFRSIGLLKSSAPVKLFRFLFLQQYLNISDYFSINLFISLTFLSETWKDLHFPHNSCLVEFLCYILTLSFFYI